MFAACKETRAPIVAVADVVDIGRRVSDQIVGQQAQIVVVFVIMKDSKRLEALEAKLMMSVEVSKEVVGGIVVVVGVAAVAVVAGAGAEDSFAVVEVAVTV